jgi:hypothetical protein
MPSRLVVEALRAGEDSSDEGFVVRAQAADVEDRARDALVLDTTWRRIGSLRAMMRVFARKAPRPDTAACLHAALAELYFLDADDPSVVRETVEIVEESEGLARARAAADVLARAIDLRRPGHDGDPTRDLVDAPWHVAVPVFREPAPHRFPWAEDALSVPATLIKRWTERYGWDEALAIARAGLRAAERDALPREVAEERVVEPPCSSTADLAARPAARRRYTPQEVQRLATAGTALLVDAARALALGERLVHRTRSLEPSENAAAVRAALAACPDVELIESMEARPGAHAERGGFRAVLARRG